MRATRVVYDQHAKTGLGIGWKAPIHSNNQHRISSTDYGGICRPGHQAHRQPFRKFSRRSGERLARNPELPQQRGRSRQRG